MLCEVSTEEAGRRALALSGATAIVAIPVYNAPRETARCLRSILVETPAAVPVLVVDDGSEDRSAFVELERIAKVGHNRSRSVVLFNKRSNRGFVDSANLIFNLTMRSDVVLVNSDVEVSGKWFAGLQAAACSSNLVASASALSNNGGILSVPTRNVPSPDLPPNLSLRDTAERIRKGSASLYPRIPTAIGHCVYIKRAALDVVGYFDTAFAPGYEEEVDWSLRALSMGFEHVAADGVYVYHQGGASFGDSPDRREQRMRNLGEVVRRYPFHLPQVKSVEDDRTSNLAAGLLAARRSIGGLSVVVDGMCLGNHQTGTQTLVVHLTRALALHERVSEVRLLVPGELPNYATSALADLPKLSLHTTVVGGTAKSQSADVVLRPYQFSTKGELEWLRGRAERLVLIQLDLIAFNDPAYFSGHHQWQSYRDVQRLGMMTADGIAFISDTVRRQAREMGLLPGGVPTCVTYLGTDEQPDVYGAGAMPPALGEVPEGFLLVIGASFLHKNRVWAIKLAEELASAGWSGDLILAGPTPGFGSSLKGEQNYLKDRGDLRRRVVDLGAVSPAEKYWLYRHAGLVLYPTLSEGFGMVPYEAADCGTPCLSTRQGSLDEVLPRDLLTLDSFALTPARELVLKILSDKSLGRAIVSSLELGRRKFSWESASDQITELMWSVTGQPRSSVVAIEVASGRLGLRAVPPDQWLRRIIDPMARIARESDHVQSWLLPPDTRRGYATRRVYHRLFR